MDYRRIWSDKRDQGDKGRMVLLAGSIPVGPLRCFLVLYFFRHRSIPATGSAPPQGIKKKIMCCKGGTRMYNRYICPECGAHLDPGEPCDCETSEADSDKPNGETGDGVDGEDNRWTKNRRS